MRGNGDERSDTSRRAASQRAGGNCVAIVSVRSAVLKRPERVESAAWLMLSGSYAALGIGGSAVDDQLQSELEGTAKQVNRYAGESHREKDIGSAVLSPVATSVIQSVGQGIRLGSGYQVKRTVRLG